MNTEIHNSKGVTSGAFRRFSGGLHSVEKGVAFRTAFRCVLGVNIEVKITQQSCFSLSFVEGAFRGVKRLIFGGPEPQKHWFYQGETMFFENQPWSDKGWFSVRFGIKNGVKSMKKRLWKIVVFRCRFLITFFSISRACWLQKITRFSRNGAPKASFEAASLWECILDRFGGLWRSILLDFWATGGQNP